MSDCNYKEILTLNQRKAKGEIRERKPAPAPKAVPVSRTEKDPNAIRTIVISGLAQSVDQKSLWKKVKKYDGAESVELSKDESAVGMLRNFLLRHTVI